MQRLYKLITYLFFPGNMALLGLVSIYSLYETPIPWLYFSLMLFCFVVFPIGGIAFLIKTGKVDDLQVFKREQRSLAYLFAVLGAGLAIYITVGYYTSVVFYTHALVWILCILLALLLLWLFTQSWLKISAHMTGTAGFLALSTNMLCIYNKGWLWFVAAIMLNAMVYKARRGLSAHSHKELIAGFCLGFIVTFALTLILLWN